jgi:hypothetical protein
MKDVITFRGDRNVWIDFVAKVKKERKEVWEVLAQFMHKYLNSKK